MRLMRVLLGTPSRDYYIQDICDVCHYYGTHHIKYVGASKEFDTCLQCGHVKVYSYGPLVAFS